MTRKDLVVGRTLYKYVGEGQVWSFLIRKVDSSQVYLEDSNTVPISNVLMDYTTWYPRHRVSLYWIGQGCKILIQVVASLAVLLGLLTLAGHAWRYW